MPVFTYLQLTLSVCHYLMNAHCTYNNGLTDGTTVNEPNFLSPFCAAKPVGVSFSNFQFSSSFLQCKARGLEAKAHITVTFSLAESLTSDITPDADPFHSPDCLYRHQPLTCPATHTAGWRRRGLAFSVDPLGGGGSGGGGGWGSLQHFRSSERRRPTGRRRSVTLQTGVSCRNPAAVGRVRGGGGQPAGHLMLLMTGPGSRRPGPRPPGGGGGGTETGRHVNLWRHERHE